MEKSIYSSEYRVFLSELKKEREARDLTQVQIAERLGQTQSFISKVERGERRLDVVELRVFCEALGVEFISFLKNLEKRLGVITARSNGK